MQTKSTPPKKEPPVVTVQKMWGLDKVSPYLEPNYQPKTGLSTRLIGIEVEVENYELNHNPRSAWILTEDGSLRNNGVEWITRPIQANYAEAALTDLFSSLVGDCCFSPRTSVHIHVNCQDMPVEKLLNVPMVYAVVESLLYRFAGRNRDKNIYCVPLQECGLLDSITTRGLPAVISGWSKYAGLNMHPIGEKGTVEFRHMHGTNNVEKLVNWIDMVTRIVDFVYRTDGPNLQTLLKSLDKTTNVYLLLRDIFGPELLNLLRYESFHQLESGVAAMKMAFMAYTTTDRLLKERDITAPYFVIKLVKGL